MSQNKTKISGLETAEAPNAPVGNFESVPNFYERKSAPVKRGTVVAGLSGGQAPEATQTENKPVEPIRNMHTSKPVVGFLYSISRTASGEFWPLQLGCNTIGCTPECDILLPEGTVSAKHAEIQVRSIRSKAKNTVKVEAWISDARSTNGTMVNGETVGREAVDCNNGDIITVGENYELLLILIDPTALGLSVAQNFVEIDVVDTQESEIYQDMPPQQPNFGGNNNFVDTPPAFNGPVENGTVGLDGTSPNFTPGGTIGM